jgi:FkbM family methyltransferase
MDDARARRERRRADVAPADVLRCVIGYNRFGAYAIPLSSCHRPAARTTLRGGVWEEATLELIRHAGRPGDVVHAGTYFGDFIPAIAASRGPDALVHAFEPNLENYRCAEITTRLNGLENVVLYHAGLGASIGTARLEMVDAHGRALGGASRLVESDTGDTAETAIRTIDSTVPADRDVAVIQLDVEGFEQQALEGALETIQRCRPLLVVETLPSEWVSAHLAPLGYRVDRMVDVNTVLRAG